jgi:hypothetical protein
VTLTRLAPLALGTLSRKRERGFGPAPLAPLPLAGEGGTRGEAVGG